VKSDPDNSPAVAAEIARLRAIEAAARAVAAHSWFRPYAGVEPFRVLVAALSAPKEETIP
jgi:hypothetical protein